MWRVKQRKIWKQPQQTLWSHTTRVCYVWGRRKWPMFGSILLVTICNFIQKRKLRTAHMNTLNIQRTLCIFLAFKSSICAMTEVFIIIIKASMAHGHLFCRPYFLSRQQKRAKHELKKQAHGFKWFQQDNLMVSNNEILVYLLIWLLWSFSCE